MSGKLAGRTAIVTGAAQGLGAAIAQRFAREGARLALVDMRLRWAMSGRSASDGISSLMFAW